MKTTYRLWYRFDSLVFKLTSINKFLSIIIHKFDKLVYEKTAYENTIFLVENL